MQAHASQTHEGHRSTLRDIRYLHTPALYRGRQILLVEEQGVRLGWRSSASSPTTTSKLLIASYRMQRRGSLLDDCHDHVNRPLPGVANGHGPVRISKHW